MATHKRSRSEASSIELDPSSLGHDDLGVLSEKFSVSMSTLTDLMTGSKDSQERKLKITAQAKEMHDIFFCLLRTTTTLVTQRHARSGVAGLEKAVAELAVKVDALSARPPTGVTYAAAAAHKPSEKVRTPSGKTVAPQARSTIYIRPKDGNEAIKSSEDTRAAVTKCLKPNAMGLRVDRMVLAGRNAVMLQSRSADLSGIPRQDLDRAGLTVHMSNKMNPRVALYGVPAELSAEQVRGAILAQNVDEQLTEEVLGDIRVLFRFGRREQRSTNWILETSPTCRGLLIDRGRLYIDWFSCRVQDHVRIIRCFRCQKFGHLSKDCRSDAQCGHCAADHETRDCPSRHLAPSCANCRRFGHTGPITEHEAASMKCPAYQRRVQNKIEDIDYGQSQP